MIARNADVARSRLSGLELNSTRDHKKTASSNKPPIASHPFIWWRNDCICRRALSELRRYRNYSTLRLLEPPPSMVMIEPVV